MADVITPLRLSLLQTVANHPDAQREKLLGLKGVTAADVDFLIQHDLIRERETGRYRVSHLGTLALRRGRE